MCFFRFLLHVCVPKGFPGCSVVKNPPTNAGSASSIPGLGRSPGGGNGNPLRILAWGIPWTEEPGGLQPMESQRVRHNLVTKWQQPQNAKITAWFIRNNYCQNPSLSVILYQLTTQKVLEPSLLATQQCITWAKLNSKEQKWKYFSPVGFSLSF